MSSEWVKVGALWRRESKKGEKFLAGKMDSADLIIWKNGNKQSDKSPDFIVYVTRPEPREDGDGGGFQGNDEHGDIPF